MNKVCIFLVIIINEYLNIYQICFKRTLYMFLNIIIIQKISLQKTFIYFNNNGGIFVFFVESKHPINSTYKHNS